MDTIQEYNYVPNNSAQNLKRVESNTIALLTKGVGNRVIASRDGKIVDFDITEALDMPRVFNKELYEISMKVSI